ncbi:ribonuclease P protein subunit p20 [Arctopsyche grandis]|uniref:ribonuclease P protein subunit p20 n=1 Tax=Arctopsyche grandis TaxID=121162 RepID=UPI00406D914C
MSAADVGKRSSGPPPKKRLPARPPIQDNAIYITKKTNFKAQLEKCSQLLLNGADQVLLHALGAAVCRAINLALQLEATFHGTCKVEVNTSTVDLIDDFEPTVDDGEFKSQVRQNSAVHIRIYRVALSSAN